MAPVRTTSRPTAVAGGFYPDDPAALRRDVRGYLDGARSKADTAALPKAIIGPHAGYVYSGPIAGSAYAPLLPLRGRIERVVIMSPAHRVPFSGLAVPGVDAFDTPLGPVALDREAIEKVLVLPDLVELDEPHAPEHGIEVHLPFIRETLGDVRLVPIVFGDVSHGSATRVFDTLWEGDETLIVISSDLSHFHDYAAATRLDRATADAIVDRRLDRIGPSAACGSVAIRGLLDADAGRGLNVRCVDLRNSGDTAGPRDRVVGYGAFLLD